MSVQQLVSCGTTDTLEHIRHLMNENRIRHLPCHRQLQLDRRHQYQWHLNRVRR
jgi:hypothetical protein